MLLDFNRELAYKVLWAVRAAAVVAASVDERFAALVPRDVDVLNRVSAELHGH